MLQTVLPYPDVLVQNVGIAAVSTRQTGSAQEGGGHDRVRFGTVKVVWHQMGWRNVLGEGRWCSRVAGGVGDVDRDEGGRDCVEVVVGVEGVQSVLRGTQCV